MSVLNFTVWAIGLLLFDILFIAIFFRKHMLMIYIGLAFFVGAPLIWLAGFVLMFFTSELGEIFNSTIVAIYFIANGGFLLSVGATLLFIRAINDASKEKAAGKE
ncbi:hypothetical protein [Alkalicoccobacillus plakortidis]|uniref:Uncharacterized protein n=1 Tax=Alkalicoccobacillus plakortidis TaxID=444060 RepID=A0ABT0XLP3_9BACI|nr:hypothetical protein [Alkalicoccobacillus plakortidis]MCM2676834.1 hypothetical protein [Alkalicoccobacillus plakortidis]